MPPLLAAGAWFIPGLFNTNIAWIRTQDLSEEVPFPNFSSALGLAFRQPSWSFPLKLSIHQLMSLKDLKVPKQAATFRSKEETQPGRKTHQPPVLRPSSGCAKAWCRLPGCKRSSVDAKKIRNWYKKYCLTSNKYYCTNQKFHLKDHIDP